MNIKIFKKLTPDNICELEYKAFVFSGGEVSVKLDSTNFKFLFNSSPVILVARIQSSEDFIGLAMIKDALRGLNQEVSELILPYIPYARQDRVCDKGESFSLDVFITLLGALNFAKITVLDPHSEVASALLNKIAKVKIVNQLNIISNSKFNEHLCRQKNLVFCSPDAGANKKTSDLAKYIQHEGFIRADKLRDLTNGKIKETIVYADDLSGKTVVVADDICDFGGTFILLAQELKKKKAEKIILYVTHGIFAGGFDKLFESGINEIWTTNSFKNIEDPKVNVLKIEELLSL